MNKHPGVFISHSFDNKAGFHNVADALKQANVPYWNPDEVKSGDSLRGQLRRAVEECSVCVFVATRKALKSSWCGAELGAFWGAGKPIIVFLADSSLREDELPPIVQGDVWEERISRVAERAGELVKEADSKKGAPGDPKSATVGNLTVGQLEQLIAGAVSLAAATTKSEGGGASIEEIDRVAQGAADSVVGGIDAAKRTARESGASWRRHILWVDDRPENNVYERKALEALGVKFTLALSTDEALEILSRERFAAVISDMGRREGPREGYVLLDRMRGRDDQTPFLIYAGSRSAEHRRQAAKHGGQGVTNDPHELYEMVIEVLTDPDNLTR